MKSLPLKNLSGKPVRTAVLIIIAALLSFTMLAGGLVVTSLRSGLSSLEDRLGADIMVVPYEATTKSNLENIVLQGSTGSFYMDMSRAEKVHTVEGIGRISDQFFLASTKSDCCSIPVQIIGFDPETDFTITPWIRRSGGNELGLFDVVVGNDLNAFVGDTMYFYGIECNVAAKLDKTGTSYDTTVFTNEETVKVLLKACIESGINKFESLDPDNSTSCILIDPDSEHTAEEIVNDINLHVKKVRAIQTKEMISGISDGLGGISDMTGWLVAAVWLLGLVILLLVFTMSVNERKKEFAVLRVIGASRSRLAGIVMQEALVTGAAGSLIGAAAGLLVIIPFSGAIEEKLSMPFLTPPTGTAAVYALAAVLLSAVICAGAAAVSAFRMSRIDTAVILRGDN
ncbi:MAG: ABC transporter permease [Ruminococcus sp.]|nr:ABC transporter permease [Ruminococcus sp.]